MCVYLYVCVNVCACLCVSRVWACYRSLPYLQAIGIRLTSTDARVDREREEELRRLVDQNAMLQAFIDDAAGARKSTTEVSSPRA